MKCTQENFHIDDHLARTCVLLGFCSHIRTDAEKVCGPPLPRLEQITECPLVICDNIFAERTHSKSLWEFVPQK